MNNTAKILPLQSPSKMTPTIFDDFKNESMQRLMQLARQAGEHANSILISGEIGTGKKTLSKYIHSYSNTDDYIYLQNTKSDNAKTEHQLIEHLNSSHNATLVVDNIELLSIPSQYRLNQYLSEQTGMISPKKIVAITTSDILAEVNDKNLLKELYYRLNIIKFEILPLRKRKNDIAALAKFFLENHGLSESYVNLEFTSDVYHCFNNYNWNGNIIELKSIVQRAIILSTSYTIDKSCIEINSKPKTDSSWIEHLPVGISMKKVETNFILETLKHHNGNRTHAAKTLGISLRTLRNKINEFKAEGLSVTEPRTGH